MLSVETGKKVCRWCAHPDRRVNVQGFCCQLCYSSWFSKKMQRSWERRVAEHQAQKEKDALI